MAHLFFMVFPCLNLYLVCFFVADSVYCHNELGKNRAFFGIYRNTGVKKSEKHIDLQKVEKQQQEHIGGNVAYYRLHAASCYASLCIGYNTYS
jgi:hypothetical protein